MKRAMSGKGRGGSPPLPRQRFGLRMVQLSLVALAAVAGNLAYLSLRSGSGVAEVLVLSAIALSCLGGALWMGLRTVRGPEPPCLD